MISCVKAASLHGAAQVPLHDAVRRGDAGIVELLLKPGTPEPRDVKFGLERSAFTAVSG